MRFREGALSGRACQFRRRSSSEGREGRGRKTGETRFGPPAEPPRRLSSPSERAQPTGRAETSPNKYNYAGRTRGIKSPGRGGAVVREVRRLRVFRWAGGAFSRREESLDENSGGCGKADDFLRVKGARFKELGL